MKKSKLLLIPAVLALGSLASCGGAKEVSLGLGYNASYDAGKNQFAVDFASVAFDAEGKVVDVMFDTIQVSHAVSTDGSAIEISSKKNDNGAKSKLELGTEYGMQGVSELGLEVDAQIENFAAYCVGKTVEEIASKNYVSYYNPTGTTTIEGCSISVGGYVAALQKAYSVKKDVVSYTGKAKVGLGVAGAAEAELSRGTYETTVTFNASLVVKGKIVDSYSDCLVQLLTLTDGAIAAKTEGNKYLVNGVTTSKHVLGAAYAMAGKSPIGAEWDAQVLAFDAGIVGKTADEIASITEETFEGCTIEVVDLVKAAIEAINYAK